MKNKMLLGGIVVGGTFLTIMAKKALEEKHQKKKPSVKDRGHIDGYYVFDVICPRRDMEFFHEELHRHDCVPLSTSLPFGDGDEPIVIKARTYSMQNYGSFAIDNHCYKPEDWVLVPTASEADLDLIIRKNREGAL